MEELGPRCTESMTWGHWTFSHLGGVSASVWVFFLQGNPRTTTLQRTVRTASRAQTRCCGPGTASHPCWTYSGCLPSRASRRTVASPCASINRPCPSRTTSKRGATRLSKANRLFLRQYWPASPVSVHSGPSSGPCVTDCGVHHAAVTLFQVWL